MTALVAHAQTDFRNSRWGMSKAQVIASESARPSDTRESGGLVVLEYDGIAAWKWDARVLYIFIKDKLTRAKFVFTADHAELNDFIADYRALEPELREKHGKPTSERAVWEDDSTQLEPKSYLDQDRATPASILPSDALVGLAVSLGHLKLYTEWETPRTKILHALTGVNHQITHQIEYRSAELESAENQNRKTLPEK